MKFNHQKGLLTIKRTNLFIAEIYYRRPYRTRKSIVYILADQFTTSS